MSGIIASRRAAANGLPATAALSSSASALSQSPQLLTSMSYGMRASDSTARQIALSSAISTRSPSSPCGKTKVCPNASSAPIPIRTLNENRLPLPSSLWTMMSPPIMRAI